MSQTVLVVDSNTPRFLLSDSASDLLGRAKRRPPHRDPRRFDHEAAAAFASLSTATRRAASGMEYETEPETATPASNDKRWPEVGLVRIDEGVYLRPNAITRGMIALREHAEEFKWMLFGLTTMINRAERRQPIVVVEADHLHELEHVPRAPRSFRGLRGRRSKHHRLLRGRAPQPHELMALP